MSSRNGQLCPLCGTSVFAWQEMDYNVVGNLCPECTMEAEDYFGGDLYDEGAGIYEAIEGLF